MMTKYIKNGASILAILLVAAAGAWAHPGHGETKGHSLLHYFTEPVHVIPLIAVIAISVGIFMALYAKRKKRAVAEG
jgi:hypothetical protein